MSSRLTVVVGGGGVGKTTTSAALALRAGMAGRRALVVTVDPARRLADALGVRVGNEACQIEVAGTPLSAMMPDSRQSVDRFARWLFQDPEALGRVMQNNMYRELADALAGVHELVCVAFVDHELESGRYDEVVLDTAPSRHALEFLDYPMRLARMLGGRSLEWMASLARLAGAALEQRPSSGGLMAWGKKRVGHLVSHLVGADAIVDIAALFTEFVAVRERWLALVERVDQRMRAPDTRYMICCGPSGAALEDAEYMLGELRRRDLSATEILLNRAVDRVPPFIEQLRGAAPPELGAALSAYQREFLARTAATQRARERIASFTSLPIRALPALRGDDPRELLVALAREL